MSHYLMQICEQYKKLKEEKFIRDIEDITEHLSNETKKAAIQHLQKDTDIASRAIILYIPEKNDDLRTHIYRGRQVLMKKTKDSVLFDFKGLLVNTPMQLYDKKGRKTIVLEKLLYDEEKELCEISENPY